MNKWPAYKKFNFDSVEWANVLTSMNQIYGRNPNDSDFNILSFWDEIEKVRMQGFREAIEVLEEIDRMDNNASKYVQTLKCLYDAAMLSSKPPSYEIPKA